MPEAENCWVSPTGMAGFTGVREMEDSVADVTARVVLPGRAVPDLAVAVMVAVPPATAVARPLLLTVATDGLDEVQETCLVRSWLVPSEYMPEAENCWVSPAGMLGFTGARNKENRVAAVTVRVVAPAIVPEVA
jgi:hypothetical protein